MTDQIVRLGPEYFPRPTSGIPIAGGSIYIGDPDTDPEIPGNQITVNALQENGITVPISQPILTSGGGVPLYNGSTVTLLVSESYSLKVLDAFDVQVYYVPSIDVPVDDAAGPVVEYIKDLIGLINVSSPVEDQTHTVLSYFDGLNKGGGNFYWDSLVDKATANGGTIVDPDNIGGFDGTTGTRDAFLAAQDTGVGFGCWMRIIDDPTVLTKWFGAVADGITEDTDAIQKAIDTLLPVHSDEGTYLTDALFLPNNAILNDVVDPDGTEKGDSFTGTNQTIFLQFDADNTVLQKSLANGRLYNWTIGPFVFKSHSSGSAVSALDLSGMTFCIINQIRGITNGGNAFYALIRLNVSPNVPAGTSWQCYGNTLNSPIIESSEGYAKMIWFDDDGLGAIYYANANTINTPNCFNIDSLTHAIDIAKSYGCTINSPVIELCPNATGIAMGDGTVVNGGAIETMKSCFDYTSATAIRSTVIGTSITNNGTLEVKFGTTSGANTWTGVNDRSHHVWVDAEGKNNYKGVGINFPPGSIPTGIDITRVVGATGVVTTTTKTTVEAFSSYDNTVTFRTESVFDPSSTGLVKMTMATPSGTTGYTFKRIQQDLGVYETAAAEPLPVAPASETEFIFTVASTVVTYTMIVTARFKLIPDEMAL